MEEALGETTDEKKPSAPPVARRLSDLVLPTDDDPNELLKYRFLCRGGGLVMVGPAGVGKSVLAMQFMILWALGREGLRHQADETAQIAAGSGRE